MNFTINIYLYVIKSLKNSILISIRESLCLVTKPLTIHLMCVCVFPSLNKPFKLCLIDSLETNCVLGWFWKPISIGCRQPETTNTNSFKVFNSARVEWQVLYLARLEIIYVQLRVISRIKCFICYVIGNFNMSCFFRLWVGRSVSGSVCLS